MSAPVVPPLVLYAALALALLAAGGFAWTLARIRQGARDLGRDLAALRRHPLVGAVPPAAHAALDGAAREVGLLVDDLREHVVRAQDRASAMQALADGPADVALIGLDTEWLVASFSRGAARLTGWAADEIAGRHVEVLFAPGEWERLLPKLARRSVREEGFAETVALMTRAGGSRPCRVSVGPGGAAAGGTLLVARDLASEIDLERRLRLSEERHRRLVEEVRDGVVVLQGGRVAYANPALARLLGREGESLQGRLFKDLIEARDLLRVVDLLARAERGAPESGETSCRLATPGRPPIEARLTWSATEYQGRRAVFCTVADVTERARHERVLVESEARQRATLEAAGDGLVVFADTGRGLAVTLANPAFLALAQVPGGLDGAAPAALAGGLGIGAEIVDGLVEEARAGRAARRDGVETTPERRAILDLAAAPVRARTGEILGVVLTARDVTARVDQERALRATVDEMTAAKSGLEASIRELGEARTALSERNTALERLNTELRSLDEMKSGLLANVSHELHTPLVSIKGYTEMILKRKLGPLTPEQERGLQVANKNIDRLIELIDNLLSFARLETGEARLSIEDIPLWQLVDEAVDLVGERIRRRNISITTQYESDDLVVRGDRVKLGQVFTNLLTNAVKFNRDGGRIALAGRRAAGGFVEVEVSDTGIGIAPDQRERIFERFYQVESGPRRRYEGTGIGLSIVRDILRLHGGSIRVQSVPEEGSTFTFTLPMARRSPAGDSRPAAGRTRNRGASE
jgi:PAS domain S-box-containing protein